MPVYGPNLDIASSGLWDIILIADVSGDKCQYTPKSDLSLRINNFPHLVLEIISDFENIFDQAQSGRNRMLLQSACLARLGNALRRNPEGDPFIVSAIYIDYMLCATWYLLYQPNVSDTTVGLISQDALHYLRLGRLDM